MKREQLAHFTKELHKWAEGLHDQAEVRDLQKDPKADNYHIASLVVHAFAGALRSLLERTPFE